MKVVGLQTHIWSNNLKSMVLLALFPLILLVILSIIFLPFVFSESSSGDLAMNSIETILALSCFIFGGITLWFLIAWAFHTKMIMRMTHSNPISREANPRIYNIVENLTISRGLPMPKIYQIEDDSLNAFATGLSPTTASISFSRGLLEKLNDQEVEAVAAHELTHIMNQDTRLMVIAIIFVGIIQTISEFFLRARINVKSDRKGGGAEAFLVILALKIVVFLLGFVFTLMVQFAISRKREFLADAGSVELTKNSQHLISALRKIELDPKIEAISNRSVAQLCIDNPLSGTESGFMSRLFSTHPPVSERIKALEMIG